MNIINSSEIQKYSISKIVKLAPPYGWRHLFTNYLDDINEISDITHNKYKRIYPYSYNVFNAFHLTPFKSVKVVIIGQDPYPSVENNTPQAMGLSFSIKYPNKLTQSLRNIYKLLAETVDNFVIPKHGDLTSWAMQGVFLINSYLTVSPDKPTDQHTSWASFITKIIEYVAIHKENVVFILWGKHAAEYERVITDNGSSHLVLIAPHPAARGIAFKHNHFNDCNEYLELHSLKPIDWTSICY